MLQNVRVGDGGMHTRSWVHFDTKCVCECETKRGGGGKCKSAKRVESVSERKK